jgi:DUF1680 family protein
MLYFRYHGCMGQRDPCCARNTRMTREGGERMAIGEVRAHVNGGFWKKYADLVRKKLLPNQWEALNDRLPGAPESHSIENFRIAAGLSTGARRGMVFQDSDLYKWLEAAGYVLADTTVENPEIAAWAEEAIDLIARAQSPDGYIDTYFTLKAPDQRWKNLREAHEMYCAGHLMEAAVSMHRGTGNRKILESACRLADHIDSLFGTAPGKLRGYPGHEEIELALVKLYRHTGKKRYLDLASYFIDERGRSPNYFTLESSASGYVSIWGPRVNPPYHQAHAPVREQADAVGHAVRAMYLCAGMAEVAAETGDLSLIEACERLWLSVTSKRMYVTGAVGSCARDESIGPDHYLPNDSAYAETCAAIGLFMFSHRMARLRGEARYADVMERTLFNAILPGLSLDGTGYFYVNPLEVSPEECDVSGASAHVKYRRQPWFECACCPPNIARLLASLGHYAYRLDGDALFLDLFHDGDVECHIAGRTVSLRQRTGYPWEERVVVEYAGEDGAEFDLALRLPAWCAEPSIGLNGSPAHPPASMHHGYAHLRRAWKKGDIVELILPMPVRRVHADPRVKADYGKTAVQRGPIIYCLEAEDNGPNLHSAALPPDSALRPMFRPELLGGVVAVTASGRMWAGTADGGPLYSDSPEGIQEMEKQLTFIPYYAWANRGPGEMTVWVRG